MPLSHTQWSQPTRHFIGDCSNNVGGASVSPTNYYILEAVGTIQSYLDSGEQTDTSSNVFEDSPQIHSVHHFERLYDASLKTITRVWMTLTSNADSVANENAAPFLFWIENSTDAPDPSGVSLLSQFDAVREPKEIIVDTELPESRDFRFDLQAGFLQRRFVGLDSEGNGGVNVILKTSGSAPLSHNLQWVKTTLKVECYG